MSTIAADAAPAPKGKKKLILIIAIAVAVLLVGGGAALMLMKKSAADAELDADYEEGEGRESAAASPRRAAAKRDTKAKPPTFSPMEPFTVNLADRNADRYAQVAVTLELDGPETEALLKSFMPAVRSRILLALADHTAGDLLARDGKEQLAARIQRETARAMGYDLPTEEELAEAAAEEGDDPPTSGSRKRSRRASVPELPIVAVHFSNFIIQ